MTLNHTRELLIRLSSHMAYMQGQLEARHELDDPEDYYWYRESVALRQKVIDALAADGPAVPVAVSERLPEAELCWWYEPDEEDDDSGYGGSWTLLRIRGNTVSYTHWLPAHALPLPAVEVAA